VGMGSGVIAGTCNVPFVAGGDFRQGARREHRTTANECSDRPFADGVNRS
jgi:hypothetical protein